jgi:hypothetical protein
VQIVCFHTPNSRATSSASRPASTCFSAAMTCVSVCLFFDIATPLLNTEIALGLQRKTRISDSICRTADV